MTRIKFIPSAIAILMSFRLLGQDSQFPVSLYPEGITVSYGIGSYSLIDEYISGERYSGGLPLLSINWARLHDRYTYQLELEYRGSQGIENYNVSTGITQFTLNQGFLYPLKKSSLFRKDLYAWIGPSTEFFLLYNKPEIAVSGFDYAQSFAGLLSLGFKGDVVYSLNPEFFVETSLRLSLLSLGLRMVDSEEDDQSPVKPLTSFSGLNSSFDLGIRYYLFYHLSVKLAYKFEFTRISAWEPLKSASDNLVFTLNYRF